MSEFNFKSQICTDKVQSERLLALGLKKETADMKYLGIREYYGGVLTEGMSSVPMIIDTEDDDVTEYDIPAWSLHRLIEIAFNSLKDADADAEDEIYFIREKNPFESMIELFEWIIKEGYFNKEYLEEK